MGTTSWQLMQLNERDYFAALEATTSITITNDKLVFSSAQGQALLTFAK